MAVRRNVFMVVLVVVFVGTDDDAARDRMLMSSKGAQQYVIASKRNKIHPA